MVDRVLLGNLNGEMVFRVSTPGFNVLAEPLGSKGIAFDSRLDGLGTVLKQGVCTVGQFIPFGSGLPYVPVVHIARITPNFVSDEMMSKLFSASGPTHFYTPYVAVVSQSGFSVERVTLPFYDTAVPDAAFAYSVFSD